MFDAEWRKRYGGARLGAPRSGAEPPERAFGSGLLLRAPQYLLQSSEQPVVPPLEFGNALGQLCVPGRLPTKSCAPGPLALRNHSVNRASMTSQPGGVGRFEAASATYEETITPLHGPLPAARCLSLCHWPSLPVSTLVFAPGIAARQTSVHPAPPASMLLGCEGGFGQPRPSAWRGDRGMRISAAFEWAEVGHVTLDHGGRLFFGSIPPRPGIYRFRLSGSDGTAVHWRDG
jgi:hypothetical protein